MFSPDQIKALQAPLLARNVAARTQSGFTLSYIEGWHAIAEANRIFGFDGWNRETLEMNVVSEHSRAVGKDKVEGWGVSYLARVRITVWNDGMLITKEGTGAGHGIDRDLGLAHESAAKEAETDAMKRALMMFGNPFGLALYDKTQEHVADFDEARIVEFEEGIEAAEDNQQLEDLLGEYGPDTTLLFSADRDRWGELSKKMAARKKEFAAKEQADAAKKA